MKRIQELMIALLAFAAAAAAADVQNCCRDGYEVVRENASCTDGSKVKLECEHGFYYVDSIEDSNYFTEEDGSFYLTDDTESDYCLYMDRDNDTPVAIAFVCHRPYFDGLDWVTTILMMISLPFLAVTILIYWAIPALRDLNGKCIIGYLLSLGVSYIVLISRVLNPFHELCSLRGAFLFVSTLSVFAWLNLVTFNVWKSIRNKAYQMSDKKLFHMYLGWSVGVPFGLCLVVFVLDLIPGTPFRGHFMMFDCGAEDLIGYWVLFYTPMIILIVLNVIIFAHACWILWRGYRDPNQARIRALRFKCLLILRLFFLSGIPWTFEILSLLLDEYVDLRYLWFFFDCINSGQGFIVFLLLVVLHKRALRAIQQSNFLGLKWPERWGERDADSVSLSELDKVALEQMKDTLP